MIPRVGKAVYVTLRSCRFRATWNGTATVLFWCARSPVSRTLFKGCAFAASSAFSDVTSLGTAFVSW